MEIAVVSRNPRKLKKHIKIIEEYISYVGNNPDVVVAVGGDGTFLAAEHHYPGVPKLLVREDSICKKCDWDNLGEGLKRVTDWNFKTRDISKLSLQLKKKKLEAVNDVVIRNAEPTHAIRFNVFVDKKRVHDELIGDGVVISTVFGSEGYFRSITGRDFKTGIGLAFNNTTNNEEALFLNTKSNIVIEITRGIAHVAVDNNPNILTAKKGDKITVKQSKNVARLVQFI